MLYTHDGGNDDIYKKRLIKTETFWKNSCFKEILHNFSFPVNMCVYTSVKNIGQSIPL